MILYTLDTAFDNAPSLSPADHTNGGTRPVGRTDRRLLKTITLTPPEYKVPNHILADSYLEKEVKFAGVVPNIPVDLDCTNRTDVLRVIDRGKQEKILPWTVGYEHDAIFSLNIHNIKISKRDGNEELLLRLPIHEVAASCYIRDEEQHLLAIKFGTYKLSRGLIQDDNQEMCQLAVLHCDSRASTEELCGLIGQCFQLVFTDATMHFLDSKVSEAAAGLSIGSSTLRSDKSSANSTPKRERMEQQNNLGFLTQSSMDLEQMNGAFSSLTSQSMPRTRRSSNAKSDSELSTMASEMIQDYMHKIWRKLNYEELRRFAMLVKAWHSHMAFSDFCEQVLELYGPERKQLLVGMKPFIPEKDIASFDTFLDKIGLGGISIWSDTMTPVTASRFRSYNGNSTVAPPVPGDAEDPYDQRLNEISNSIESLGTSVSMSINMETSALPRTT